MGGEDKLEEGFQREKHVQKQREIEGQEEEELYIESDLEHQIQIHKVVHCLQSIFIVVSSYFYYG